MDFNETKLRFGDVAMELQAALASKDSCPIASSIYSGRGSRADCRFGDCAICRFKESIKKMKKENTIQLVGGFVLACLVVGVFVTGAYLEWPGFYKHADCHCCDDIWWDHLFPPLLTLSLPWILVFPLLLARRAVAKCLWKRICGILAVGITFGALLFQGGWIVHWSYVAINCVGGLFAHEDILICSTIILGFLLVFSIFLSGEFICVKLFFKPDCFGR